MSRILTVGVATLDIINTVDHYPAEDEELRASTQSVCRGGNAANTAALLAQLGHKVAFIGTLADDAGARFIEQELRGAGIEVDYCPRIAGGRTPTSYITLNEATGSRTIVHYRELPELAAAQFATPPLADFDWCHFEGRNVGATARMLRRLRATSPGVRISLEIEKPRTGIETLYPLADILIFARAFVVAAGYSEADSFLAQLQPETREQLLVCTWGSQGAFAQIGGGATLHAPAVTPHEVIDSVGAGDVFNAGLIDALARDIPTVDALNRACRLAGRKVGRRGLKNIL